MIIILILSCQSFMAEWSAWRPLIFGSAVWRVHAFILIVTCITEFKKSNSFKSNTNTKVLKPIKRRSVHSVIVLVSSSQTSLKCNNRREQMSDSSSFQKAVGSVTLQQRRRTTGRIRIKTSTPAPPKEETLLTGQAETQRASDEGIRRRFIFSIQMFHPSPGQN